MNGQLISRQRSAAPQRPSRTALAVTFGRAAELRRRPDLRIVADPFAPLFLGSAGRLGLLADAATGATRLFAPVERTDVAALGTSVLCRHRYLDEQLLAALPEVTQILVLGAGYDARAYRFAEDIGERTVFEVDLPALSRRKAAFVARHSMRFGHASVVPVEVDFRSQSLGERLRAAGFRAGAPAFVAWEGVAMYLSREAVDGTLAELATVCGPASVLAMDLWQRQPVRGAVDGLRALGERGLALIGEPVRFRCPPASVDRLLGAHGFEMTDLASAGEMTARYATDGRHCDPGMYVTTARLPS